MLVSIIVKSFPTYKKKGEPVSAFIRKALQNNYTKTECIALQMALFLKIAPIICCLNEQFVICCVLLTSPGKHKASVTGRKETIHIYGAFLPYSSGMFFICDDRQSPNQSVAVFMLTWGRMCCSLSAWDVRKNDSQVMWIPRSALKYFQEYPTKTFLVIHI